MDRAMDKEQVNATSVKTASILEGLTLIGKSRVVVQSLENHPSDTLDMLTVLFLTGPPPPILTGIRQAGFKSTELEPIRELHSLRRQTASERFLEPDFYVDKR